MSTTVVIPTWNERAALAALLPRLRARLPEARLLVVDDGSPDGSAAQAEELGADVLVGAGRAGLAQAYVRGFRDALAGGATRIVQMDADGSHDPDDLPRLLAVDADLVLGSRYVPGGGTRRWPWQRRALSRFGCAYARWWTGLDVQDLTGGFKVWRAGLLASVLDSPLVGRGYVFQVETTRRAILAGAHPVEVPIVFVERALGASKMTSAIALEAAWRVPLLGRVPG